MTAVYALADMAGCGAPDGPESPGARFLLGIARDVVERLEDGIPTDTTDMAQEIADAAVPVYTLVKWKVFVDLTAYNEDLDGLGHSPSDMDKDSNFALYVIAERLVTALIDQAREAEEEEEG